MNVGVGLSDIQIVHFESKTVFDHFKLGFKVEGTSYVYDVYVGSSRLLEPHTMGWGGGVGC